MSLRTLRFFRMVNGQRVPCVMTLDDTLLVVSEVVALPSATRVDSVRSLSRGVAARLVSEPSSAPGSRSDRW